MRPTRHKTPMKFQRRAFTARSAVLGPGWCGARVKVSLALCLRSQMLSDGRAAAVCSALAAHSSSSDSVRCCSSSSPAASQPDNELERTRRLMAKPMSRGVVPDAVNSVLGSNLTSLSQSQAWLGVKHDAKGEKRNRLREDCCRMCPTRRDCSRGLEGGEWRAPPTAGAPAQAPSRTSTPHPRPAPGEVCVRVSLPGTS